MIAVVPFWYRPIFLISAALLLSALLNVWFLYSAGKHSGEAKSAEQVAALQTKVAGFEVTAAVNTELAKRAEKLLSGAEGERVHDKVAKLRFPDPAPSGKVPLTASDLSKSYGSLEIFTDVDLAVDRGTRVVVLGLNGAGKTTLLRMLAGTELPDTGEVKAGHGLRVGYYAQEHETIDMDRSLLEVMRSSAPDSRWNLLVSTGILVPNGPPCALRQSPQWHTWIGARSPSISKRTARQWQEPVCMRSPGIGFGRTSLCRRLRN